MRYFVGDFCFNILDMKKQNKQLSPAWDFIEIASCFNQFIGGLCVGATGKNV